MISFPAEVMPNSFFVLQETGVYSFVCTNHTFSALFIKIYRMIAKQIVLYIMPYTKSIYHDFQDTCLKRDKERGRYG